MRSLFLVSLLLVGFAATVRPADAADVRMYIRHEVADYVVWRRAYNAFDATRRKLGVIVTHDFKTADKAKAFASSPDLKTTMEKAGVKGTPQIWFTTSAAR